MNEVLCIACGRIVDPANNIDEAGEIFITDGKIAAIRLENTILGKIPSGETRRIVALNAVAVPGLIDLHVHFRDPGLEYKEDIFTGCAAAAAGGFTTVCMMPNTKPVLDCAETIKSLLEKKAKDKNAASINTPVVGAITHDQQGTELTNAAALKAAGACALSEDGRSVANAEVMLRAMRAAENADMPIFDHTEDDSLKGTAAGEACMAARDIILAQESGARLHLCHISAKLSLELIRSAKAAGAKLTAETAPHYFTFDSSSAVDGSFKMNPPLREKEDVEAVIAAIKDGTIDAIATDHAPHGEDEKNCGYTKALNGVIGLETSFPVSYTRLVKGGHISFAELIKLMSTNPADILGDKAKGRLTVGSGADIALFDIEHPFVIKPENFCSKGRSTPFKGMEVMGKTLLTVAGGKIVYSNMENISEGI